MRAFLGRISPEVMSGKQVLTFDTWLRGPRIIRGSAAPSIATRLSQMGARLVAQPESFMVMGMQGPLAEGEIERARSWARAARAKIGAMG